MGTISSAFSLISGALDADQSALSIVANNVANANTTGYTRESPNWQENSPVEINGIAYGSGVTETGPTSVRDRVLDERLAQQQQSASSSGARLTSLNAVQALFAPDSGSSNSTAGDIGSDITSFFNSFSSLEANPTDNALRQQVLSTAATLAGDLSNAATSLNAQSTAIDQEAAAVPSQVNALASAIAQLNLQIQSASSSGDAGTLEDQRQQDLSQLSQLIGINQITTENNGLSITTTSGQLLVSEGKSIPLTTGMVGGTTHFFLGSTDVTQQLAGGGGTLGGYLMARDLDIPDALASLDQLAYGISVEVNAQNTAGTDLDGVSGSAASPLNIFRVPPTVAGSAIAMSVVMTDPNQVAAASPGQGNGDNSNATAMANLASRTDPPILSGLLLPDGTTLTAGQSLLSGQTPISFYSSFVTRLGATVAQVQTENTAQNASVSQLQTQRNSLSSVNLNDEASVMQMMERSYQAASQVFTMLNTIMTSALNLGVETAVS
jgi:flagellar hook-associated protein 1 FlgK